MNPKPLNEARESNRVLGDKKNLGGLISLTPNELGQKRLNGSTNGRGRGELT